MSEKRLIDANALLEKMEYTSTDVCADYGDGFCEHGYSTQLLRLMVSETPAVDAVEVVHAYWIKHDYAEEENGLLVPNYECSACHSWERDKGYYCPNCGAKMDGDGSG